MTPPPGGAAGPEGAAPVRTLRIDVSYDGTRFEGWQRQSNGRSVQQEVERALERVTGAAHSVVAAGRTDAGVHARRMTTSTRTPSALPAARLVTALDALLPADVGVLAVHDVPASFHARRDARWKWYRYRLLAARTRRPLLEARVWRRPRWPGLAALQAAAAPLLGRHDVVAFGAMGSPRTSTVRTIFAAGWSRRGAQLRFDVVGDGFLHKMVRTLVGTQLAAARLPDPARHVLEVREARDRRRAGVAAPARGLTLMTVGYADDPLPGLAYGAQGSLESGPP